ncbi:putative HMP/thiamine permease protein YkoE [Arthrobacter sp. Hiyo4]|nr:putative HMP/thiamine permease protein YkoE [Arthrobacter sp. Hiyo4]
MTTAAFKKTGNTWRVVDIVVAALIAITGGVIFWAWSQGAGIVSAPMNAVYPPLTGLIAGGWMIPAVLGMLIIRKPGAALFCEAVAATGELIMGSQYGATVLISGLLQGLGAELVFFLLVYGNFRFKSFLHQKYNLIAALLAGAGAACSADSMTPSCRGAGTSPTSPATSSRTSCSAPSPVRSLRVRYPGSLPAAWPRPAC